MTSVDGGTSSFDVFVDCFGEMYKLSGEVRFEVPNLFYFGVDHILDMGRFKNGYDGKIICRRKEMQNGDQWTYELFWYNTEKEMPKDLMEGFLAGCKDRQITRGENSITAVTSAPFIFSKGTQVTIKKTMLAPGKHLKAKFSGREVDVKQEKQSYDDSDTY